jgi:Carboxypeptidase regulatory-like domain
MRHPGLRTAVVLSLGLLFGATLAAQSTNSHLTGTVRDAQGGVLPGVTVTATAPSLIGTQVAVSETNGSYLFPSLPSGTYTLKFELQGFQTLTRANIVLALGQTLTVDAQMQVASLKENVTVTAASPVVDTQSTSIGNTLNTQKLISVPSSTDLWGALGQSPGIHMNSFDVGGSNKFQQSGYTAYGISGQSRIVTEGVDTTEGTSGAGFYQDYFSQSEIAVSGAGQDVSMNTPGAAVISTIKSGGNTFKGLVNQTYEGKSFVGSNSDAAIQARGGTSQPNLLFWENHDDLGGPIKRDRLWFFAAFNHFHIDQQISGVPTSIATNLGVFHNFTTKETWKPSQNNTLIGYYQYGLKAEPLRGLAVTVGPQSALAEYAASWMYNGKWERVWTNRLFTELNVGEFGYNFPEAGFTEGGTAGPFLDHPAKPQMYGDVTYYLPTKHAGSHDLKFGFEWINEMWTDSSDGQSGPILYLTDNNQPDEIRVTNLGDPSNIGGAWTVPINGDHKKALYAQDRWTATNKMTITAGVRYDRQSPYYTSSTTDPLLTELYSATTVPGKVLFTRNNFAPRIGISIDPSGQGKTALKVFYGRYYYNFSDTLSAVDPGGPSTATYKFLNTEGDGLYHGLQDLGTLLSSTGGSSTTYNPNMPTPYTDEIDVSAQQQFWGESSIRLAYIRKMENDNFATYNQLWVSQFTVPVNEAVTIQNYGTGVQGVQDFTVYDIPNSLKGKVSNIINTAPGNASSATFGTVEVAFTKRFARGLFLDSSFDWTRLNQPYANSASNSSTTQSNPIGAPTYFENIYPTVPNVQQTSEWQFHLSSHYEFRYQIGIGANFDVQNGWNYARLITVTLPNSGTQKFWAENLSNNRSESVPYFSLRLDKAFDIARFRLTGMLDIFNVLNANPIVNFNLSNGSLYNEVNGVLPPRTLQLGVRFEF